MVKLGVVHWLENQKALVQHWGPAKDLKMFTVTIGCIGENVFPIWGEMLLHFIYLFIAHFFHSLILFFFHYNSWRIKLKKYNGEGFIDKFNCNSVVWALLQSR